MEQTEKISFAAAKALLDERPGTYLVDVRTEEEYTREHALGALWLPLDDIDEALAGQVLPGRDSTLLLYCRTGNRSGKACQILRELGYRNLYNLGGLNGWPYGMDFGI